MSSLISAKPIEPFSDVLLIQHKVFGDARGFFLESFNQKDFEKITQKTTLFVQDNHSRSNKGVLRGVHYQLPPRAQGKLIRVVQGSVYDVVVDLRKSSPTFGKWEGITLNETDGCSLWIPPGFGHGFLVLEDETDFLYKTTDFYSTVNERVIAWNDPKLGIKWPIDKIGPPLLSSKDSQAPKLSSAEVFI